MREGRAHRVIMDVDTGVDDAMALAMAVVSPAIDLLGVTTVVGNVSLAQATQNTLDVLDFLGADDVPVYQGAARPLVRQHVDAAHFHGHDGLGGAQFPRSSRTVESMSAPEYIVQTCRQHQGEITLLFVGPLTNLAIALILEPELPQMVARVVIMGGAFDVPGNATPHAEFNIAVDPEAAGAVAESALNATWVGLDVTNEANLYRSEWSEITEQSGTAAQIVKEVSRRRFEVRGDELIHLHDPLAMGALLKPELLTVRQTPVAVDVSNRETAGTTRMKTDSQAPRHQVAVGVNSRAFRELFGKLLGIRSMGSNTA